MRKSMWQVDSNFNKILDMAYAFQKSKVFFTAVDLDIFNHLGDKSMTAEDLAITMNTDKHSTDRLLSALCSLGLVHKDSQFYKNSPASRKHLVQGGDEYIGSLLHINNLWESWSNLTHGIRTGKPLKFQTIDEKDDEWIEDYLESLRWKSMHEAPEVVLKSGIRSARSVLELGCGSATHLIEIIKHFPHIECFAFDYPNVIKQTKKIIEQSGCSGKIKTVAGDFMADDIGSGYDVVLISNVLEEYSIWDNIKLLQKVYDSLNKNGRAIIHQNLISDDRTYPRSAVMDSINLIVNTPDGDAMTETDIWIVLKESWYQKIESFKTEFGTTITVGHKLTSF